MLHYQFAQAWLKSRAGNSERGASLVEFLVISAGVAIAALAIIVIYTTVVTNKANAIDLG